MTDSEITRLVMRINAEAQDGEALVKIRDLLEETAVIRRKGYAFTCDMVTRGGGISEVMRGREEELSKALMEQIDARFGRGSRNVVQMPNREPSRIVMPSLQTA
jgi:hypothetical protein